MNRIITILLATFLISCTTPYDKKQKNRDNRDKDVETMSESIIQLPKDLQEISGISFINDNELIAIEDETGMLYFYDLTKKEITEKRKFAGKGDYEDVTIAGNDVYVVVSGGTIYEIKDFKSGNAKATTYKTPLTQKNDVEGLAYDAKNARLLMTCKNKGLNTDSDDKYIYAFDLNTKKFNPKPVYIIDLQHIEEYYKGDAIEESSKKFLKALGNESMNKIFRSSALTVDPKNQNILILSSMNNIIAVLSPQGKLINMISLKGKEFIQPEGIAFTPSGKLYVSNEGDKKKGNIIKIDYEN